MVLVTDVNDSCYQLPDPANRGISYLSLVISYQNQDISYHIWNNPPKLYNKTIYLTIFPKALTLYLTLLLNTHPNSADLPTG